MKRTLYYGLLVLFVSFILLYPKKVKAVAVPTSELYMTEERAQAIINYYNNNHELQTSGNDNWDDFQVPLQNLNAQNLANYWNNHIYENIEANGDSIIKTEVDLNWNDVIVIGKKSGKAYFRIFFIFCNTDSASQYMNYLNMTYKQKGYQYAWYGQIDIARNSNQGNIYYTYIEVNSNLDIYGLSTLTTNTTMPNYFRTELTPTINGEQISFSGIYGMRPTQTIYWTNATNSTTEDYFLADYYTPAIPSGDSSGDTGTAGTITNNSGETTGNINLQPIQNSLNNIEQNTTQIIKEIKNQNEEYWGSGDELTLENQSGEVTGIINEIYDNISGELSTNEAFQMIETAEQGVFNIFRYGENNPELLDFIISWDTTNYQGIKLISGDSINFSQMCREIETLGTVKSYINTIMCFWASWAIIKQIYNLILSTLGIDNRYLYEEQEEWEPTDTTTTTIDMATGEIVGEYYTKRRKVKK